MARGGLLEDLRVVLRGRDFRKLFATRLVSQAADGAFQAGLAGLFFFSPERAATAGAAAAAFAVAFLPYSLVGPFAGVLLDRWRRRQVLLVANLVRTLLVLGVAGLVLAGAVGPVLYVAVLACLSVNRFFLAGLGASLPHVVPGDELVMANAVSPTSGTVAALLGAGAGYGVRVVAGPGDPSDALVLVVAAAAYLASALLALRMAPDLLGPDPGPRAGASGPAPSGTAALSGVARGLLEGARHTRSRRPAVHALAVVGAHRFALGLGTVAVILLCRNHFSDPRDTEHGLGLLAMVVAVTGAGYGFAAVVAPVLTRRVGVAGVIVLGSGAAAVAQAAVAAHLDVAVLAASGFLLGTAVQSAKICVDAILQAAVDDGYRGRVFSFYDMIFNGAFVAAAAAAALVLPPDGVSPPALAAAALLYALTAVLYGGAARRARPQMVREYREGGAAHPPGRS